MKNNDLGLLFKVLTEIFRLIYLAINIIAVIVVILSGLQYLGVINHGQTFQNEEQKFQEEIPQVIWYQQNEFASSFDERWYTFVEVNHHVMF